MPLVTYADWRDAPAGLVAGLYQAEQARWLAALEWDLAPSWNIVEPARASGLLPGVLAREAGGAVLGWAFYLLHDDLLQIGALVAERAAVLRGLLDRILASPEARRARSATAFLFPRSGALAPALVRQRFRVERACYLRRALGADREPAASSALAVGRAFVRLRPLAAGDGVGAVRLLARAYAGVPGAAAFAPRGRLDEWAHYFGQLTRTAACGACLPAASFVAVDPLAREPVGLVLTTRISARTAHVAQLAVDPAAARHGIGRRLVAAACDGARAEGCDAVTLLVAADNHPACRLYRGAGFAAVETFAWAVRTAVPRRDRDEPRAFLQPRLSTSAAPCLGATTRR